MVGVSSTTTPNGDRDTAGMGYGLQCKYVTIGTTSEVLQAGDEVADGAVAVSPVDEFTQTVRGGLNWVGHDRNLQKKERGQGVYSLQSFVV